VIAAGAGHHDGKRDGREHEDDGRPGGEASEEVGGAARTEGGLRTLAAEGSSEVGGLALLEQDHTDEEEADDNVQDYEKNEHGLTGYAFKCMPRRRRDVRAGTEDEPLCLAARSASTHL